MSSSKIVIAVLILLAAIFAISIVLGVHSNSQDQEKARCCEKKDCPRTDCAPDWSDRISGLLGSHRPAVDLPPESRKRLSLIRPSSTVTVAIPAAEASFFRPPMRTATFRLISGDLVLTYRATEPETIPDSMNELRKQELHLPREKKSKENDDLQQGSLAIMEKGGLLQATCNPGPFCNLEIK
jgi:hypothetical protein